MIPRQNPAYPGRALTTSTIGQELYVSFCDWIECGKDLSGNTISTAAATIRMPIKNSSMTRGALGPSAMTGDSFSSFGNFVPQNFSTSTFGFAPPVEARPMNTMAGQTTIFHVGIPISRQIPSGGSIVLTFPTGFVVTGAKQDTNSPMRRDFNGPGPGTVTFKCLTNVATNVGKSCAGTANTDDAGDGQGGLADDGVVVGDQGVTIYLRQPPIQRDMTLSTWTLPASSTPRFQKTLTPLATRLM